MRVRPHRQCNLKRTGYSRVQGGTPRCLIGALVAALTVC